MTKSANISILTIEYSWESMVRRALLIALVALTVGYLYLVASSVQNIIARKEADTRARAVETSIGSLERQYYTLASAITPAVGTSLGLSEIGGETYVYRPGAIGNASTASRL